MNNFCGVGRLATEPELKYTPAGVAVCHFRMAFRNPINKDADGKPTTDFFNVTCWRDQAEFVSGYLTVGREVAIQARLRSESWMAEDGTKRNNIYLQAERIDFVGPKPQEEHPTSTRQVGELEHDPFN